MVHLGEPGVAPRSNRKAFVQRTEVPKRALTDQQPESEAKRGSPNLENTLIGTSTAYQAAARR